MEFILHLPQEINKDGTLWQTWDSFYKKCLLYQSTELHRDSVGDSSSLLLFAGSHHINSICSSLKVYNLNLEKLTKVLHIVEQVCLPYFILLFERFRYFSMKQDLSNNLDDSSVVLQKQAEICEFVNLKDGTGTNVGGSSPNSESQDESFINAERSCYNKVDYNNGSEKSHGSCRDDNPVRFETLTSDVGLEMFDQSGSSSSQDADLSTSVELNSHSVSTDSSLLHPEKNNTSSADKKHFGSKLTGVLNKWNVGRNRKLNKSWKIKDVCFRKREKRLAVTSLEKGGWNSEAAAAPTSKMGEDINKMSAPLTSTIVARENLNLKQFQCCQCDRVFAGRNCFKKHLSTKHKGCSEFVCKVCKATYADAEKYLVHYTNAHTVEQKMRRARRRPVRIKLEDDVRNFECTICRKVFPKKWHVNKHLRYNHKQSFLCWHCGEELPNMLDYKQHSEKHVINGKFLCDLCQKPYNNLFRLDGHLKNHLQPQNKCGICGLVFIRQESLAKHVEKHTEEPAHMCKICGKDFVRQGRLQCHLRTHSGEKRFTCELCGKTYAQKATLVRHRRCHTGEQPYECEICGKRTRSLGELSKHKRKHSDKFSCVCEICGKGFNYSSSLLEHRLGHMGKRSYACDMCGRTYIYREGLRAHLKSSRCPGRAEAGIKRTPRATKLSLSGVPDTKVDELKVFKQVHQSTETGLKDVPDWHCLLRNNEPDGGTSVVLVPSFY
ncbi:unnamed protein product [Candidula unifasciata]|uniref:C2H2-type domain-containing protein n=1 Tax=Candidula unifasciata TaxID=100452 RepID=A0A8S3ZDJ4_9EUPU|nr:unnamed protein product [Candidula unifasciata]